MTIDYKKYMKVKDKDIDDIVRHLYKSPINITKDVVGNYKRVSKILMFFGIVPGILYKISKRNFVANELSNSYSQLISTFWKRLSSIQGHCGMPKISTTNNALVVEQEEYTSQKLEKIIESFQNASIFDGDKFEKPKFYDPSFKLLVEKLGIQDFFYSSTNLNGKLPANWEQITHNAIYQEQLSSTTTKILFSYYDQLINVSNYVTYSRAIVKDIKDTGEKSFYVDNIINSKGFILESKSDVYVETPFVIVSRDWDYQEEIYGMDCIDEYVTNKKFKKQFSLFAKTDGSHDEVIETLNDVFIDKILEYQEQASAFIIYFDTDGQYKVFWQEIDSSLTPFSENNLVLFAEDEEYGMQALFKEAYYIKMMFRMLDIIMDYFE